LFFLKIKFDLVSIDFIISKKERDLIDVCGNLIEIGKIQKTTNGFVLKSVIIVDRSFHAVKCVFSNNSVRLFLRLLPF
jgi:hypothetical protein